VAASVTTDRALRYAGGSARGLLHQALGHCQYICKVWTSEPERFILDPIHQMPGLNTSTLGSPESRRRDRVPTEN